MRLVASLLAAGALLAPGVTNAQIVPPRPGVEMPQAYFDQVERNPRAFQFDKALFAKTRRAREARQAFLSDRPRAGGLALATLPRAVRDQMMVSGTVEVPVVMIKYANTGGDPYPTSTLQAQLFSGPNPNGTMTQLYTAMSYGNLTLTGTVYPASPSGWVQATQNDLYYEGGSSGLGCTTAKTGQLIREALEGVDAAVNFGKYDNDGPDGVPNSGDDDGLVDFIAFVQPEIGGECGSNSNMWSHRWVVGGWPEFGNVCATPQIEGTPWMTNDNSANGGKIGIWDYTIQPAKGSNNGCGTGTIEIGVFAHEFGHAFGLPDLYDTDFGGAGIGAHGLMGSGNWNRPPNPAHMSAWSKLELGWVSPTEVTGAAQSYNIPNVDQNPTVFKLDIFEEKFERKNINPISGAWSLHCGLAGGAAAARNWSGGAGYGNGWSEAVKREFVWDGGTPVTLKYDVSYDTEVNYDFGRIKIDVGGQETALRSHTGVGALNGVTVDLSPHLLGSGATSYTIIAEFVTDFSLSDEDGGRNSGAGGPFKLDNISVTGGGENYSTDFEQREDGWHYDLDRNPTREFFLVENRNKAASFDQHLYAEGLFIWHIEQNVVHSRLGNTGGSGGTANLKPAGVTLIEADGLRELLLGQSGGDAGDVFPGSTDNRTLTNSTTPDSKSHNNWATNVVVNTISNPVQTMTAVLRGGHFPPVIASISASTGSQNAIVPITDLSGGSFVYGAEFLLRGALSTEYLADKIEWVGKDKLTGEFNLVGVPTDTYDVVVRNPDGQEAIIAGGFVVTNPGAVSILGFTAEAKVTGVELGWQISTENTVQGYNILRKKVGTPVETTVNGGQLIAPGERTFVDKTALPSTTYQYSLAVVLDDNSQLRSQPAQVTTIAARLALYQNKPNPFNPTTIISFSLPKPAFASLNIYDVAGRRIRTLVNGSRQAGINDVIWNGDNDTGAPVGSGVYFYRLEVDGNVLTRKLLLVR